MNSSQRPTVINLVDFKTGRHCNLGCCIIFELSKTTSSVSGVRAAILEIGNFARVTIWRIVGETDVEEARVFLRYELMHIVCRWPDVK